jgi:hypothetical protein
MTGIDDLVSRIRAQMELDSETEREVLAEIRDHLEDSLSEARASGLGEAEALAQVASRFGVEEEIGQGLQAVHAGWGTADAVIAAALPVAGALILRWLAFAPDGTALGWPALLGRPAFWIVALAVLVIPMLKFERWRYALVAWALFWILSVLCVAWPAVRW